MMTASEYIDSGAIEACLMGSAHQRDLSLLHRMEHIYPEVLKARKAMQEVLEKSGNPHTSSPGASSFNQQLTSVPEVLHQQILDSEEEEPLEEKLFEWKQLQKPLLWVALALLMASTAANYLMYRRHKDMNERYNEVVLQQDALMKKTAQLEADFQKLSAGKMKTVVLTSAQKNKAGEAMLYWDNQSGDLYLWTRQMKAPDTGNHYQLWATQNGKTISAGNVDWTNPQKLVKMKNVGAADSFLITEEPARGSAKPTPGATVVLAKL